MISSLKNQPIHVGQPKSPIARSSIPAYLSSPQRKKDNNSQSKQHLSNEMRNMSSMLSNSPSLRFTQVQQKLQAVLAKPANVSSTPVSYEQQIYPKASSQSIKKDLSSKDTKPNKVLAVRIQGISRISSSSNSSSKQSLSSSESGSSLSSEDYKKARKTSLKKAQKMDALCSSSDSIDSSSSGSNSSFESNRKKNKQVEKAFQKNSNNTYSYKSDDRISYGPPKTKAQIQAKKSIQQMNKIFGDDPKQHLKISKEVVKQLNQQLGLERSKNMSRKHSVSSELSHSQDSNSSSSSSFENIKQQTKDKKFKESKHPSQAKQQSEFNQFKKYNPYL